MPAILPNFGWEPRNRTSDFKPDIVKTLRKMTVGWLSVSLTTLAISIPPTRAQDCVLPTITGQPANQVLVGAGSASFCVNATGDLPLSYQWLFNGTRIGNATNRCFSIGNAGASHVGTYSIVVSNCAGAITSTTARLDIHGLVANYIPSDPEYRSFHFFPLSSSQDWRRPVRETNLRLKRQ